MKTAATEQNGFIWLHQYGNCAFSFPDDTINMKISHKEHYHV